MRFWTEEKVSELQRLFKEGHTDLEIAKRIKTSDSAVLGKRHRLGLVREQATPVRGRRGKAKAKLTPWNAPDPNDPGHALDARDYQILDACVAGEDRAAIAKRFKVLTSYVDELWRVREFQEPVGEAA
jgi:hypothetical protein